MAILKVSQPEGCLAERGCDGCDDIIDGDHAALEGRSVGGEGERHAPLFRIVGSPDCAHLFMPARNAEYLGREAERMTQIIVRHDPGCPQAAALNSILDMRLGEENFFEHLGKGVAARCRRVRRRFVQGSSGGIEVVTDRGITTDQDEISSPVRARKASSSQNMPLTVTSITRSGNFLPRGHMDHMRDALHDGFDEGPFGDVAGDRPRACRR